MIVYLAGPINGCLDYECKDWRQYAKSKLPNTIDPMRRDYRGREHEAVREIVEGDKKDIRECDTLLVYFDRPSVGTAMEILLAWAMGKRVVIVDKSYKPLSPWLKYHSHSIFSSLDEAIEYLLKASR